MNVIIPLGGLGVRFKQMGFNKPKPLINVIGQSIINWLLHSLNTEKIENVIIPYNRELDKYRFESQLSKEFPTINFKFKKLNEDTKGSCETLLIGLTDLDKDSPILCIDGDNFFIDDVVKKWNGENCCYVFKSTTEDALYSYSKICNGQLEDIKEKEKISEWASAGIYGFESAFQLRDYCKKVISNTITDKGEFYVSVVIKQMLNDKHLFKAKFLDCNDIVCLGTPLQVRMFCSDSEKLTRSKKFIKLKKYCFDLDNTLVTYPIIKDDYTSVLPIEENIRLLQTLKNIGNQIIIYTARRMKTHSGNVGKIIADIGKITIDTLNQFNIPYDELYFGKPHADFYIDDLGVSAFSDFEKELGLFDVSVNTRSFNTINESKVSTFLKSSDLGLSGEINYYKNIPNDVKDLFCIMIRHSLDNNSYEVEKINGVTLSKLYLAEELTKPQLLNVVEAIQRIHNTTTSIDTVNIYANYSNKLVKRYKEWDYSNLKNSHVVYESLLNQLTEYENCKLGKQSVIHGDPVFTNIILNSSGKLKFIDMRGMLGDKLTILGDSMYDWAKLYQSLMGYDEIIENKYVSSDYKNNLRYDFESIFVSTYTSNHLKFLKIITKSLLFTLIPLHEPCKHDEFYNLINHIF